MRKSGIESICVKDIKNKNTTQPHVLPIYATATFEFEDVNEGIEIFTQQPGKHVYSRYGNPTIEAVAEKIMRLECFDLPHLGYGIMTSSGMASFTTLLHSICKPGDTIATQGNLYGGTTELLMKHFSPLGINIVIADFYNLSSIASLVHQQSITTFLIETPSNPTLRCIDISGISQIAKSNNISLIVDNTFCSPILQRPLSMGADFTIHSTTKYMNGMGTGIGGIIVGKDVEFMRTVVWERMKLTGTNCNPFDAWLVNNGLKTLNLRMQKHCSNAMHLATFLNAHPNVLFVNYPGLTSHPDHALATTQMQMYGGMLSFEVKGGLEAGKRFMNALRFCAIAPSLGEAGSMILHPASMSHVKIPKAVRDSYGITDGLIRLSVGIEEVQDILSDLETALSRI